MSFDERRVGGNGPLRQLLGSIRSLPDDLAGPALEAMGERAVSRIGGLFGGAYRRFMTQHRASLFMPGEGVVTPVRGTDDVGSPPSASAKGPAAPMMHDDALARSPDLPPRATPVAKPRTPSLAGSDPVAAWRTAAPAQGQQSNEADPAERIVGANAASAAAAPAKRSAAGARIGDLSMAYETGYRPGQEAQAAAKVSTGQNDPRGGVSYGAYQLSSKQGQVQKFLQEEGKPWAGQFDGKNDPMAPNGAFQKAWQASPPSFEAQHAYIERTHYNPVVRRVLDNTGLDVTTRSPAVQNVVWSMAVNHGRAARLVSEAVNDLQGKIAATDPRYDAALINQLYDVRRAYVGDNPSLLRRYANERRDALAKLGN